LDLHKWYLDDGILAGPVASVAKALRVIRKEGPPLGLTLNLSKCELFSSNADNFNFRQQDPDVHGTNRFPSQIQRSTIPHFVLLGSPIGDASFCEQHITKLRDKNKKLLESLCQLEDTQVALHLLRTCASFCKFVYIARTTSPLLIAEPLKQCDSDFRACLSQFAALQLSDTAWSQAQLSLSSGGLGLRSTSRHCAAAYIASHTRSLPQATTPDLTTAFELYAQQLNTVFDEHVISGWLAEPPTQRSLSIKLEKQDQQLLRDRFPDSVADRVRLYSVSSTHSSAWLQALPSRGPIDLTLSSDEMQVALQHRLGIPLASPGETCGYCSSHAVLDVLGHHQLTCSTGGFVATRHNRLRDALHALCSIAGLNPKKEQGSFSGDQSRPADLLVADWSLGKPAAFDLTIVSPLVLENIEVAGDLDVVVRAADKKHKENDPKCALLGWVCVPLAVDSYGQWCEEAHSAFSQIASHIQVKSSVSLSVATNSIYNTLGIVLARRNARAILSRRSRPLSVGVRELHQLSSVSFQQ
jgi:hypothetical protein